MNKRDGFSPKVRNAVAARAGWHCSFDGCPKLTVGPSDESSAAVTNIGVAAHMSAAAPGGRRYVAKMSKEERAGIDNAIWLCADHATFIDRDEQTYTIEALRAMKRRHEATCERAVRTGSHPDLGSGLLAVGPSAVFSGEIVDVSAEAWTLKVRHFLVGDIQALIAFIDGFAKAGSATRYVLSNQIGDGRTLSSAPKHA